MEQTKKGRKMNQLAKIEVARQALAEAKELKDVKLIIDKAEAIRHFLKQQNCTIEIQNYANIFCIEAQIKLGEMLKEMPKNEGVRLAGRDGFGGTKIEPPKDNPPTYFELGIDKKDASRCQQMAENKKEIVEKIGELERSGKLVKESTIINQVRKEKHHEEIKKGIRELPLNKYRILLADPPWDYGNSGLPSYGHSETHYPSMTIGELCNVKIKDLVEDNAVLFLWVTSPMLEACFEVINAWGFKYRTSIVWNKDSHNFGYYVSVRHEFLLICVRGSCLPDIKKLLPSVVTIKRDKVHSRKPNKFREMIDELYPKGKRIELFAREKEKFNNWDVWGNQCS